MVYISCATCVFSIVGIEKKILQQLCKEKDYIGIMYQAYLALGCRVCGLDVFAH